jgi:hypothetical protein
MASVGVSEAEGPAEPPAATPSENDGDVKMNGDPTTNNDQSTVVSVSVSETEGPVEEPVPTERKRGSRGRSRCSTKQPFNEPVWCQNCKTLNAMTTKPRSAARSFPCTGLLLDVPAPPPPLAILTREPRARDMYVPETSLREQALGFDRRLTAPSKHGSTVITEPTGLDAAFAKGAAAKIYTDLAVNAPDDKYVTKTSWFKRHRGQVVIYIVICNHCESC